MAKKLYYKIGEACKILEIQPYVLRYWETEFPFLKPNKSKSGQRVYSDHELNVIRRIKELLYEEGYTIAGAKKKLESELANGGELKSADQVDGKTAAAKTAAAKTASAKTASAKTEGADPLASSTGRVGEADEKLERLRGGVETALRQAREILQILQTRPSIHSG